MSDNWVVQNLQNALNTWNSKQSEIWTIISQSPEEFKNGEIWQIISNIAGALQAISLALLVIFFLVGVIKTCGTFTEVKKPEHAFKLFIRFAICKVLVTRGLEILMAIFSIIQGAISTIISSSGMGNGGSLTLPQEIITSVESCGFFESIPLWAVALIGGLLITVLAFVMILSVYGRFFKLYLYTAIAPLAFSTFAGEPTSYIGRNFLKSYSSVCLEGAIIVLACIIFSAFATSNPSVDVNAKAVTQVWSYMGEIIFNMLVLVGSVKMADRFTEKITG